jgi:hypothetical protein
MSFKEQIAADMAAFLNVDEFGQIHNIDGNEILLVSDSDLTKSRTNSQSNNFDGIYTGEIAIFVRAADLSSRPVFGQLMRLDGKPYIVSECNENFGILEIKLGANES